MASAIPSFFERTQNPQNLRYPKTAWFGPKGRRFRICDACLRPSIPLRLLFKYSPKSNRFPQGCFFLSPYYMQILFKVLNHIQKFDRYFFPLIMWWEVGEPQPWSIGCRPPPSSSPPPQSCVFPQPWIVGCRPTPPRAQTWPASIALPRWDPKRTSCRRPQSPPIGQSFGGLREGTDWYQRSTRHVVPFVFD